MKNDSICSSGDLASMPRTPLVKSLLGLAAQKRKYPDPNEVLQNIKKKNPVNQPPISNFVKTSKPTKKKKNFTNKSSKG